MDWLQQLNLAIGYIEENLAGEISYEKAARIACCSAHQFQRMFSYIAGVPLSEYIRRRRMSAAAFDLQEENAKVTEIAAKYGYQSPTAFNRAFRSVHGVPPSAAWVGKPFLSAYPRLRFQISVTGEEEMKYRLDTRGPFRIAGVKTMLGTDMEVNFKDVPVFWKQAVNSNAYPRILEMMDSKPEGILGVTVYHECEGLCYYIGTASSKTADEGMEEYVVPGQTWVMFQCSGSARTACQNAYRRFYTEWLPVSGYDYAGGPDIEVYPEGDPDSPNYRFELWLPVKKK